MGNGNSRIDREKATVSVMISLYCRNRHKSEAICPGCQELLGYALERLDECRFGEHKPTCARCRIHCYRPDRREKIKQVMRYAGPRLIYRHPILAFRHVIDGLKRPASTNR